MAKVLKPIHKDHPQYKVIKELEKEFKKSYAVHIGNALQEVTEIIKNNIKIIKNENR